jgi:hypothetical protein
LKFPVSDEADANSGKGRYNNFQNGTILWKFGANEAFAVQAGIFSKYGSVGYDSGFLGFPLTDEMTTPDGIGRYNHFEGGSIYWTPDTGMQIVQGEIRNAWASQGWEQSRLQYPISDELVTEGTNGEGRHSNFEGGIIFWTPNNGIDIQLFPVASKTITADFSEKNNLDESKVKFDNVYLEVFSDGNYTFHVDLHDSSSSWGDKYAVGFIFVGDGHGLVYNGTIGHGDSYPITITGSDPWIQNNWHKVKRSEVLFNASWKSNFWASVTLDVIANDLKKALEIAGAVAALIALLPLGGDSKKKQNFENSSEQTSDPD